MSQSINIKKILRRIFSEDLKVILTFLFFIFLLLSAFALLMGVLSVGNTGTGIRTPSVSYVNRAGEADADLDLLPDIIEGTPDRPCVRGQSVFEDNGKFMGYCTGTDWLDSDTDNDGFTDPVEDSIGTDPTSWINPGFAYLFIAAYAIGFGANFIRKGDPLKEYKEFEEQASAGVSGKSGKFAYSGSAFGSKRATEVSEEERKSAIQQDARFQRMTSEGSPEREKLVRKRNWGALTIQFSIAVLFAIFLFVVFNQSQSN